MTARTALSVVALSTAILFGLGCNNTPRDSAVKEGSSRAAATRLTPSGAAREVEVIGLDYAFSMPDSVDAGRTAFRFTNKGKVQHEYNIVLLKEGVTLAQYIAAANKNEPLAPLTDGPLGVLFARPGQTSAGVLSAEMQPGRTYAMQCINQDTTNAPTHRELGMYKSIAVRNNTPPTVPAVAVDTIVGSDYAYTKIPETFAPGWHHVVFVNAGTQRHEINVALLKPDVTLAKIMDVAGKGGDVDSLIDEPLGVLHARTATSPLGTLDFEVLPGREYLFVCTFQDTPKSPPHFALGMVTSIVSSK